MPTSCTGKETNLEYRDWIAMPTSCTGKETNLEHRDSIAMPIRCTGEEKILEHRDSIAMPTSCTGKEKNLEHRDSIAMPTSCTGKETNLEYRNLIAMPTSCTGKETNLEHRDSIAMPTSCTGKETNLEHRYSIAMPTSCTGKETYQEHRDSINMPTSCTGNETNLEYGDSIAMPTSCTCKETNLEYRDTITMPTSCTGKEANLEYRDSIAMRTSCTGKKANLGYRDLFAVPIGCTGKETNLEYRDSFAMPTSCTDKETNLEYRDSIAMPTSCTGKETNQEYRNSIAMPTTCTGKSTNLEHRDSIAMPTSCTGKETNLEYRDFTLVSTNCNGATDVRDVLIGDCQTLSKPLNNDELRCILQYVDDRHSEECTHQISRTVIPDSDKDTELPYPEDEYQNLHKYEEDSKFVHRIASLKDVPVKTLQKKKSTEADILNETKRSSDQFEKAQSQGCGNPVTHPEDDLQRLQNGAIYSTNRKSIQSQTCLKGCQVENRSGGNALLMRSRKTNEQKTGANYKIKRLSNHSNGKDRKQEVLLSLKKRELIYHYKHVEILNFEKFKNILLYGAFPLLTACYREGYFHFCIITGFKRYKKKDDMIKKHWIEVAHMNLLLRKGHFKDVRETGVFVGACLDKYLISKNGKMPQKTSKVFNFGRGVYLIRDFDPSSENEREAVFKRITSQLENKRPYSIQHYSCEHFAIQALTGRYPAVSQLSHMSNDMKFVANCLDKAVPFRIRFPGRTQTC